jgi:5,10-methylenetetrahydromethanopterin reductase
MFGPPAGQLRAEDRTVIERVGTTYDMNKHGAAGAQVRSLTADFIDRFAVVGTPRACIVRIHDIAALGIDHVMVYMGGAAGATPEREQAYRAAVEHVLPNLLPPLTYPCSSWRAMTMRWTWLVPS